MTVQEAHRSAHKSPDVPDEGYLSSPVPKPVIMFFGALRKILGRAEDSRERIHHAPTVNERGTWDLEVVVERDTIDGGYIAETRDIPGAVAQGDTEEEALENLVDAIQGVVAAKIEEHFQTLDLRTPTDDGRRFSVTL